MTHEGAIFAELRRKAGYSQEELSELLNVNASYLSRVESGHRKPSWRLLLRAAELFKVPVTDLLRAAGLVKTPPDTEAEIAALAAQVPEFAGILAFAREHPDRLSEVLAYARWITRGAPEEAERCVTPGADARTAPADS